MDRSKEVHCSLTAGTALGANLLPPEMGSMADLYIG